MRIYGVPDSVGSVRLCPHEVTVHIGNSCEFKISDPSGALYAKWRRNKEVPKLDCEMGREKMETCLRNADEDDDFC